MSQPPAAETPSCPVHAGGPVGDTSLAEPAILARPRAFYAALREQDPVHFDARLNMWLVSRYQDIVALLRDPETFSDKAGYQAQYASGFFEEFREMLEREGGGFFPDVIKSDPPEHTRIRKLMDGAFSGHRVKTLEPAITQVVAERVEAIAARARTGDVVDGVNDFAVPLTIAVICEQMGIQQYDGERIQRWSSAVTAQIGRMQDREQMRENARQICDLQQFIIAQMKDREATPREDMISDLVHARLQDGSTLGFAEAVSLVRALIIAGNDTTATAIGNLMLVLATQPGLAAALRANLDDDRYLNRFVEELLRFAPPVRGLAKMTTRETVLGGQKLPAGAHMLVLYASGNDDETQFACPREFDLERGNLISHLAFGVGIHRCIGAALARMEIKVAARELLRRIESVELVVPEEELGWLPTVATHSLASLPLRLQVATA